jgi:hypothetical protein
MFLEKTTFGNLYSPLAEVSTQLKLVSLNIFGRCYAFRDLYSPLAEVSTQLKLEGLIRLTIDETIYKDYISS